jgi:SAM-dependent methyltransferase
VSLYVQGRPRYPDSLFEFLEEEASLGDQSVVADVGSGTGLLTDPLLRRACRVHAVEPDAAMRAAAEKLLAGRPGFVSVDATAERTGLASSSVELVIAGQAFHWFDAVAAGREFRRVLCPGGSAVLVWNGRRRTGSPFLAALEALLQSLPAYRAAQEHHRRLHDSLVDAFGVDGYRQFGLANGQDVDEAALVGRVMSSSYAPAPDTPAYFTLERQLSDLYADHTTGGGRARIDYDVLVVHARSDGSTWMTRRPHSDD